MVEGQIVKVRYNGNFRDSRQNQLGRNLFFEMPLNRVFARRLRNNDSDLFTSQGTALSAFSFVKLIFQHALGLLPARIQDLDIVLGGKQTCLGIELIQPAPIVVVSIDE